MSNQQMWFISLAFLCCMVLNTVSQVIEFDDRTLQEALEKSENAIAFVDFYAVSVN